MMSVRRKVSRESRAGPAKSSRKSTHKSNRKPARKSNRKSNRKLGRRPSIHTAKLVSNRADRQRASRPTPNMSLTELQFMAKSRGIPFGGLSRNKLIKKLNDYY